MTTEPMSADHPLAARRRALFDRIIAMGEQGLASVEQHVMTIEADAQPFIRKVRQVAGATITDRPDLAYATPGRGWSRDGAGAPNQSTRRRWRRSGERGGERRRLSHPVRPW